MASLARRMLTVSAALLLVLGLSAPAALADEPGKFYDGRIVYSQVVNCPSIIWGSPYTEYGAGAYTGYYADPDSGIPGVGSPVYMHVVFYGLGNPCGGGTYFWPSVALPTGVSPYTSAPILCFYDGVQVTGQDCPGWANFGGSGPGGSSRYIKNLANAGDTWGVAAGHHWEFRIPVVGNQVMSGSTLHAYFETADGNDSPTLHATAPMYVFGGGGGTQPTVMYDLPSTYTSPFLPGTSTPSGFGIISEFMAVTANQAGTAFAEIGTRSGTYTQRVELAVPAGSQSVRVWTDWDEPTVTDLVPGRRYYWRGGWDPGGAGGGDVVRGAEQSFVAPRADTCLGQPVTVNRSLGELATAGNDVILGTAGADEINGLGGDDLICGGDGADTIDPGEGNDQVDGGAGSDVVAATAGDDSVNGAAGTDTISYAGSPAAITLDLRKSTAQVTGAGTDLVRSIENAVGGNLADRLIGTAGANRLLGTGGADVLKALGGKDALVGGKGRDNCDGGTGRDTASTCEVKRSIP